MEDNITTYIIGNGNCLFRCLSCFLYNKQNFNNIVRKHIVEYVVKNWENFKNFVIGDMSYNRQINNVEDYRNFILENGSYGADTEITAFVQLYNINILVYSFSEEEPRIFENFLCENKLILHF